VTETSDPTVEAAQGAFDNGHFEEAVAIAIALDAAGRSSRRSLTVAKDSFLKMGELHQALGALNVLREHPDPRLDAAARRLLGRIIETDPDWIPPIHHAPLDGAVDRRGQAKVFHFLKESVPYAETGFTLRSRMTLRAQQLAGFTPEVVTSLGFPSNKGVVGAPDHETIDGVVHHRFDPPDVDAKTVPFDVGLTMNVNWAVPIADQFVPNIVQAGTGYRGFETALMGIAIADRHDVPFVYEVRGFQEQTWTSNIPRSEKGEYYRRRIRQEDRCMRRADLVITIGEAMAEEIVARGIPAEKVGVVPNAVDVGRFSPREKSVDLIAKYGLANRFTIGYISNLGAREGIDDLIRAVGVLRSKGTEVACLIAGDGPERQRLDALVEDLELQDRVVLTGHIPNDQIEDHYALIDLFVVPRIDDRASRLVTPLKPLEAMAMRLPVISSDLPALRELVSPGDRGMVFRPSDPVSMASVIEGLVNDPGERDRLATAGSAWVGEHRTVESNARRYEALLRPLML